MSLVHGSRGLIHFVHEWKPRFNESALPGDAEMLAAVTALNRQIARLAPVLNSPTVTDAVAVVSETFTIPEGLCSWLRSNQKFGCALLLRESAGTLQEVASQPKYLGGPVGCLSVLHTWGRQMQYHPHVHCVVPGGGLREDGLRWMRPPSPDFFLPQAVRADRFRNRLKLQIAQEHPEELAWIPSEVWRQKWVVDVQPAGSGETALKYFSAYVYRTALGSQRVLTDEGDKITFKYKDSGDQQWHPLSLPAMEFIRRFLQHVLPGGFQRTRYYGWLSSAAKTRWERILALLDSKPAVLRASPVVPPLCLGIIALGCNSDAAQGFCNEKIKFYLFIRPAKWKLVQVDVNSRIVVELSKVAAFCQLCLALCVRWRRRGLLSRLATASPAANPGIGTNRPVHHFNFTNAIFDQGI